MRLSARQPFSPKIQAVLNSGKAKSGLFQKKLKKFVII
jgi:hypothetical protein